MKPRMTSITEAQASALLKAVLSMKTDKWSAKKLEAEIQGLPGGCCVVPETLVDGVPLNHVYRVVCGALDIEAGYVAVRDSFTDPRAKKTPAPGPQETPAGGPVNDALSTGIEAPGATGAADGPNSADGAGNKAVREAERALAIAMKVVKTSRYYLAGRIMARYGVPLVVTDAMVAELNEQYGHRDDYKSRLALNSAWCVIQGFTEQETQHAGES